MVNRAGGTALAQGYDFGCRSPLTFEGAVLDFRGQPLLGKLRQLHVVATEQVASGVFHGGDGQPVTHLGLHQA